MNEHVAPDKSQLAAKPLEAPKLRPMSATVHGSRRYWFVSGLIVLALIVAIGIVWWTLASKQSVHYTTVAAGRGAITRTVTATGSVNPELTIIVGTYVSGVIQQVYCDFNTEVKKGQVCAKIDPRPYQSVVDQAKANLAVANAQLVKDRANLNYTKLTFERNSRLAQTNAVSQDSLDSAKSVYEQAQAQITFDEATIQQHQAVLDSAQVNLDYTSITSPVDGTVVSRNVTMGQTVAASFQTPTLFLIATDLTRMQVDTNISEGDIGGIKVGDKVTFSVDAFPTRTFEGRVNQVRQSPQTVQNIVTYDVIVGANNSDLALKPGMTAATRVVIDQRNDVLRVPNQALRYVPAGFTGKAGPTQIWILRDGRPVAVPVVAGLDDDSFTEIVSGDVKAGDQIINGEQKEASRTTTLRLRL